MNWNQVKPTDIKTIEMRFEGDVNTNWDVVLKDGTRMPFYGYESGPHYEDGPNVDSSLWDDNQELYEWLCDISAKVSIPHWDPDSDAVDFLITLSKRQGRLVGTVSDIKVQHCGKSGSDVITPYSDCPAFYL